MYIGPNDVTLSTMQNK